jgi:hypothetical protein
MSDEIDLRVRIATTDDLDEVMSVALMACAENGFVNPNPAKLAAALWSAMVLDKAICAVIGPPGGRIEGVIYLTIGEMWYSDEVVVEERAIFIHPDYRSAKGGRARKLCEFGKKLATDLDHPMLIGVLSNERTEGKVGMYTRVFGKPSGAFFLYNARTGQAAAGD